MLKKLKNDGEGGRDIWFKRDILLKSEGDILIEASLKTCKEVIPSEIIDSILHTRPYIIIVYEVMRFVDDTCKY